MKGQENCFYTPPPRLRSNRNSPVMMPRSDNSDLFHVTHKVPAGDSPYVRAKRVQMVEKDPSKAVSLFWAAINSGDRVDSALKDMAIVMKQLDRSDEAIEAIKSFRHFCPPESQDSLDNVLLELYRSSCRFEEEIQLLHSKLNSIEDDFVFSGKRSKISRSQGKKIHIPIEKEYSRLLGNMAWTYLQKCDYKSAEVYYRKALSFELDRNKQCNLAICLIHLNKITEAELLMQTVKASRKGGGGGQMDESSSKSFERASQMLDDLLDRRRHCTRKEGGNMDEERASQILDEMPERRGYYCRSFSVAAKPPSNAPGLKLLRRSDTRGLIEDDKAAQNCMKFLESSQQKKKSWADMVEEDEEHEYADENENSNIVMQTPCSLHQDESTKKKIESLVGLNEGYYTQPIHDASQKNQAAKRSLCFDQNQKMETEFSSPLMHKNLDFFGVLGSSVALNNKEQEEGGSPKRGPC